MNLSFDLNDSMHDRLKVMAAPVRRRILRLVWDREQTAGEIAANFTISWPAVSQHLRVLRDAGLVSERREGRNRIYSAQKESLGSLRRVLEEEWANSLTRSSDIAEPGEKSDCD